MRGVLTAACALVAASAGCDSKFQPVIDEDLFVNATFIEWSDVRIGQGLVPVLDGVANNLEWGSPDDPARPYTYVQLSAENGFGSPGPPKFLAVKAAYTAEWRPDVERYAQRNFYLIVQWADLTNSEYANALIYRGPDLVDLEPRVRTFYEARGLEEPELSAAVKDSLSKRFHDENGFPRPENWFQDGRDDRLLVFIGTGEEEGREGRDFKTFGTPIVRNGDSFGPLGSGFLDAWWWSASRTNRLVEAVNPDDLGGDTDPFEGFAGYVEDHHVDDTSPITLDDGPVLWIENFDPALSRAERVPLRAWIPRSDLNHPSTLSSKCSQTNMGMDFPWLHRSAVRGANLIPEGPDFKLFNYRAYNWDTKEPTTAKLWTPGNFVIGYLLGHDYLGRREPSLFTFCLPGCPRPVNETDFFNCGGGPYDDRPLHSINTLHARANGRYDPITRHWVLEMTRSVTSPWGNTNDDGEDVQDSDFDGLLDGPRDFFVSFALWDDQPTHGGEYWGSPSVRVHFEPPPPRVRP